ncbi:hypothetical protein N7456_010277 [Penicillium angulare]|uniref:Zn(2)-C6 fungal-type domain-containing protein n=1 Tax=Penicillium angulare TaxID=116970 RepID=A0A9W9F6B3_9EURO|nr:hypothetical protein N7456_010277 [Penicillium angulare]
MPPVELSSVQRNVPRRIIKKRGTTRERTGCLTCRQRKKRCDLGYPVCKECVRLNYECKWEAPRNFACNEPSTDSLCLAERSSSRPVRLLIVPDPVLFWVDEHSDCTSPLSRRNFLRYYTQTFTHLMTTNMENNSFLSVFLPIAMHSPPVLNTLIAWSSSHLSLRDKSFEHVAMQNRGTALRDLRKALESDPANLETNLAMSLILCSLESIMGDNGDAWYLHLIGASKVLLSNTDITSIYGDEYPTKVLEPFNDIYAARWLLRNFAYRDIVTAVARDQAPVMNSHHFLTLDDPLQPDSYFGLAAEILEVVSHTAVLNHTLKTEINSIPNKEPGSLVHIIDDKYSFPPSEILESLMALETRLEQWVCPPSEDMPLRLLAESYRSSALIYIYRVMRAVCPEREIELSSKVATQVAATVDIIERMPTRTFAECTLLFPLFLAGGEATEEPHIKSIRTRMLDMIDSRGFRNVEVALSVLEKLWRLRIARKSTGSAKVDWLDITRRDGISLSLS